MGLAVVCCAAAWMGRSETPLEPVLRRSAELALAESDFAAARKCLDQMQQRGMDRAVIHLLQAQLNLRVNRPAEAARKLEAVEPRPEDRSLALALLGEAYCRLHRYRDAELVLQQSLAMSSKRTAAHRWLAAVYYDIGAMDLALRHLEVVAEQDQDDPRPLRLQALIYKDFERDAEAIAAYEAALKRISVSDDSFEIEQQEIKIELAECLVRQHRYEEARVVLNTMTESVESLVLKAQCELALNASQRSHELIAQALQKDSKNLAALLLKSEHLTLAGQDAEARKVLESAVSYWPKSTAARHQLSGVLRRLGHDDLAGQQAQELQRLQALGEEFTLLHERAFNDSDSAELRYRLAEVALELGKSDLAQAWLQAALGLDPSHPKAMQLMGKLSNR
jgi:tetratricopeptide (TPR) repeat protein